jgi:hypothetical protein
VLDGPGHLLDALRDGVGGNQGRGRRGGHESRLGPSVDNDTST